MKRLILSAIALLALAAAALAQQGASKPPQTTPQPAAPQMVPKGKVAVINTNILQEQILEFRAKLEALNRQFEPQVKDLQGRADKIRALETTIETQRDVLGAAKVAQLTEQLDTDKRDYQRRQEDLQAQAGRARDIALKPVNDKMSKFAADYTARKGVTVLFDLANAFQSNTVVWFDPRIDVTKDFINEYNKANPTPTTPAPPNRPPGK